MAYKRILTIQDISCVGQCSMTVALPILSACGHETCILPTAVLSTHTGGFGTPKVIHFDEALEEIYGHWIGCGITFDAVLVGYLGSVGAIESVKEILNKLLAPGGIGIVDPAMADHGKLYSGFHMEYAEAMKSLCAQADLILPNLTEAALLSGIKYQSNIDDCYVNQLLDNLGNSNVILTGVGYRQGETGALLKRGSLRHYFRQPQIGTSFHGTGDIFAASFAGALMSGLSEETAVQIACDFTSRCIKRTVENPAHWYGVRFEEELPWLIDRVR